MNKNISRMIFGIILTLSLFGLSFVGIQPVGAQTDQAASEGISQLIKPFGGYVTATIPCTCSYGSLLYIYDFTESRPVQLIYIPFISRLNMFFAPLVGNYVLGTYYNTSAVCYVGATPYCTTTGSPEGYITTLPFSGFGTSLRSGL